MLPHTWRLGVEPALFVVKWRLIHRSLTRGRTLEVGPGTTHTSWFLVVEKSPWWVTYQHSATFTSNGLGIMEFFWNGSVATLSLTFSCSLALNGNFWKYWLQRIYWRKKVPRETVSLFPRVIINYWQWSNCDYSFKDLTIVCILWKPTIAKEDHHHHQQQQQQTNKQTPASNNYNNKHHNNKTVNKRVNRQVRDKTTTINFYLQSIPYWDTKRKQIDIFLNVQGECAPVTCPSKCLCCLCHWRLRILD